MEEHKALLLIESLTILTHEVKRIADALERAYPSGCQHEWRAKYGEFPNIATHKECTKCGVSVAL